MIGVDEFIPGQRLNWNNLVDKYNNMVSNNNRKRSNGDNKLSGNRVIRFVSSGRSPKRTVVNNIITKKSSSGNGRTKKKGSNLSGFDINSAINEVSTTLTRGLSNPFVLLTIALSIGMIYSHDFDKKTGYIYETFGKGEDVISKWIVNHGKKFCGMLTFLPAVVDSPRNSRTVIALIALLWVLVIPEVKFIEYFIQSLALHTYFKLRQNNSKIVVVVAVALAWFMGYFTPIKPKSGS